MSDIWRGVFGRCWIEPRDLDIAAEECGEAWPGTDCADWKQWAEALATMLSRRAGYLSDDALPGHVRQAYWRAVGVCIAAHALADHGITLAALMAEQAEMKR